jgi:hypothetical protein
MSCAGVQGSADIAAIARLSVINAAIDSARRIVGLHCDRQRVWVRRLYMRLWDIRKRHRVTVFETYSLELVYSTKE